MASARSTKLFHAVLSGSSSCPLLPRAVRPDTLNDRFGKLREPLPDMRKATG
ncbi:MAG: hypothetical protein IPK99_17870 [Flavobacteriales bacterium]|nr:hypothetical protein [Flavobacteriales bacterium]